MFYIGIHRYYYYLIYEVDIIFPFYIWGLRLKEVR